MAKRTNNNEIDFEHGNASTSVSEYHTSIFIHDNGFHKMKGMKRKAVSEIISVLLLLAVTVSAAVLVSAFFQGNSVFRPDTTNTGTQSASVKIIGYDTRDGSKLSGIEGLDNVLEAAPILCIATCSVTPDALPADPPGGTEFIVLTVRNQGINNVHLQSVEINNVEHPWDSVSGVVPSSLPAAGKFSIISISNAIQSSTNELQRNAEVRLVVKLSEDIVPDIDLNQPIKIKIFTDKLDTSTTIVTSGGAR